MLFDNQKLDVSMTGKEYIKYRESRKLKLSRNQQQAIVYFGLSFIGVIIIGIIIQDLTYVPPTDTLFSGWYDAMPNMAILDWSNIGKLTFLYFAPLIVICICIAWVLHGFGFLIVKG